jgi:hypothetical protein
MKANKFLIWFTGYNIDQTNKASHHTKNTLANTGMMVLYMATFWAALFSYYAYLLTIGLGLPIRIGIGVLAAIVGFVFVAVFDRSAVYASDTGTWSKGGSLFMSLYRTVIMMAIGIATATIMFPQMFPSEMRQQSAIMLEPSERSWRTTLEEQHGLVTLVTTNTSALTAFNDARGETAELPEALTQSRAVADQCDRKQASCRSLQSRVSNTEKRRLTARTEREKKLETAANDASERVNEARRSIEASLASKRKDQLGKVNERSYSVAWELFKRDVGVQIKVWAVLFVKISLDMWPLLSKIFGGQTALGYHLARQRKLEMEEADNENEVQRAKRNEEIKLEVVTSEELRNVYAEPKFRKNLKEVLANDVAPFQAYATQRQKLADVFSAKFGRGAKDQDIRS